MAWSTSDRHSRLPSDWQAIRRRVRARAHGRCEAQIHAPGCDGRGVECDHIQAGDDHSLTNLQMLSHACHKAKTQAEAAARNRRDARLRLKPREPHPGLIASH